MSNPLMNIALTSSIAGMLSTNSIFQNEIKIFFTRALAVYTKTIKTNPWEAGGSGGGVPVDTGKLRGSHLKKITGSYAYIRPTAGYAEEVHEKRPWLEYAIDVNETRINKLIDKTGFNIFKEISK